MFCLRDSSGNQGPKSSRLDLAHQKVTETADSPRALKNRGASRTNSRQQVAFTPGDKEPPARLSPDKLIRSLPQLRAPHRIARHSLRGAVDCYRSAAHSRPRIAGGCDVCALRVELRTPASTPSQSFAFVTRPSAGLPRSLFKFVNATHAHVAARTNSRIFRDGSNPVIIKILWSHLAHPSATLPPSFTLC